MPARFADEPAMRLIPLEKSTKRVVELSVPVNLGPKKAHPALGRSRAAYVEPHLANGTASLTCLASAGCLRCEGQEVIGGSSQHLEGKVLAGALVSLAAEEHQGITLGAAAA